jgi:hypothetical protein
MKRLTWVVLLLLLALATPAAAAPDPLACTGYSTPRAFLDDQSWWLQTPGQQGTSHGHVHAATCFPLFQVVSGVVPFDVRLTMHENPGSIQKLTIHVEDGNNQEHVLATTFFTPGLTCALTCDFWQHLEANTTVVPLDGWQRFTIRAIVVEPDGKEMHTGSSYRAYLANGHPRKDSIPITRTTGKGWYSGTLYANSSVDNYSSGAPRSGIWDVKVVCNASKTTTGCLVTIDPDFHHGNNGQVQLQTSGQFNGTVHIATTQLANGPHKLVVRTDVRDSRGSTLSGVLGLPFTVSN